MSLVTPNHAQDLFICCVSSPLPETNSLSIRLDHIDRVVISMHDWYIDNELAFFTCLCVCVFFCVCVCVSLSACLSMSEFVYVCLPVCLSLARNSSDPPYHCSQTADISALIPLALTAHARIISEASRGKTSFTAPDAEWDVKMVPVSAASAKRQPRAPCKSTDAKHQLSIRGFQKRC